MIIEFQIICNQTLATFYPDGKSPIAGTAVKQPDGSSKFYAHNAAALPVNSGTMIGSLKTASMETGVRGVMESTSNGGEGIFHPESANSKPGWF